MKDLTLLVWLSQLGLSVALPPVGFILLAVWLRDRFDWGSWVLWAGIMVGLICAVDGLRSSLKAMSRICRTQKDEEPPVVCFQEHE